MTYSPAQARKFVGIAESTLSKYSRLFGDFLSSNPQGKKRTYTQSDLETLAQIKRLFYERRKVSGIRQLLARPADPLDKDGAEPLPAQNLLEAFASLQAQVELLSKIIEAQELVMQKQMQAFNLRISQADKLVKMFRDVEERLHYEVENRSYWGEYGKAIEKLDYRIREVENRKITDFRLV